MSDKTPGRCCAKCSTPGCGCANTPCACHNPKEAIRSIRTVGGLYDLVAAVVAAENPNERETA